MAISEKENTVEAYLEELSPHQREIISDLRDIILQHIPDGYEETINWGMISYEIPLSTYPDTYNDQPLNYISLAALRNHNAIYLMSVYQDEDLKDWLEVQFKEAGKRMNLDRSCLKFDTLHDLPLDAITEIIGKHTPQEFIDAYEEIRK